LKLSWSTWGGNDVADELNPRQLWEIVNKLEALDKKHDRTDMRLEGVIQALDGVGQQPGIRQQLRELKHAVEGNPPAMRGIVMELVAMNDNHAKLRRDFEAYVDSQDKAGAKRDGVWGGAKTVWTLMATVITIGLGILGLLLSIYNSVVTRGGS
jgi:hypothetical protein